MKNNQKVNPKIPKEDENIVRVQYTTKDKLKDLPESDYPGKGMFKPVEEDGITLENWELRLRRDGIYAIEEFITQLLVEKDKDVVRDLANLHALWSTRDEYDGYSALSIVEDIDNLLKKYKGEK